MRLTPLQREIAEAVDGALRLTAKRRDGPAVVYQDVETGETLARFRPDLQTAYVNDDWVSAQLHAVPDLTVCYAAPPPPPPAKSRRKAKPRPRRRGQARITELAPVPAWKRPAGVLFA
ncbi:MAG TPA: hypothetical protein VM695_10020 [Phycisphaerae bacterium]|nr:hypothetical protein [Phycisphaerae bacterium]